MFSILCYRLHEVLLTLHYAKVSQTGIPERTAGGLWGDEEVHTKNKMLG